jgi:two-component system, cell cycle sensor histidine kinase and response regulator CckA
VVDVETSTVPGVDGTYAVLRVSDRGHGIEPETLSRIFEPYFTTRRAAGGSGLGLAIVHAIVQRAGGFIDIETVPGRGTTVCVSLPVVPG